jgi:hypothetical protein
MGKGPFTELMAQIAVLAAAPFVVAELAIPTAVTAGTAAVGALAFEASRSDILKTLAAGLVAKKVITAGATVMGTATFINFISEEAMQTAGMACFVARGAQDPLALRAALDNYEALYREAQKQAAITTWATPFAKAQFDSNLRAVASAIDAYEAALGAMKKTQAATRAARWAKDKLASLKAANAVYEQNALEAMNAGELELGGQWLEKIADAGARLKARGRVVKAASKTWKAAVAAALKAADVAEAWRALAFIPDAAVKAAMQGKITDFEAKVEAKLQAAKDKQARSGVAAQNKVTQAAKRTAYFASLPEAQQPDWYKQAAAMGGKTSGSWEATAGNVYYSKVDGKYSVVTTTGIRTTTNATTAAAMAQAAGGKATVAGLTAGH